MRYAPILAAIILCFSLSACSDQTQAYDFLPTATPVPLPTDTPVATATPVETPTPVLPTATPVLAEPTQTPSAGPTATPTPRLPRRRLAS